MRRILDLAPLLLACGVPPPPVPVGNEPSPKAEPSAPVPHPPAPPEGAAKVGAWWVQSCDEAHACPSLLQPAGERHCAELRLGGLDGWRLPERAEAERWRGATGLSALAGYHWTSTAFDQDPSQVWIVDPSSDQPTTIPRDRKPFTVRCVRAQPTR